MEDIYQAFADSLRWFCLIALDISEIIGDKSNTLLYVLCKIFLRTYDTPYKVEDNF